MISKSSRKRAVEALHRAGHEVLQAEDGEIGLAVIGTDPPDCVLLDMLMPVVDGYEFLSRLRGGGSSLPVVVVTADIQTSTRERCEQLGVSGFLQKPARGEEVCRAVADALVSSGGGLPCN